MSRLHVRPRSYPIAHPGLYTYLKTCLMTQPIVRAEACREASKDIEARAAALQPIAPFEKPGAGTN